MSNTNGGEFDRVIIGYGFDTESFEEESKCHYFHMWSSYYIVYIILVPFNVCYTSNEIHAVRPLHNFSGYVFCTRRNKGIIQMCPPGSEIGGCIYKECFNKGCVNKTSK
jgi:hypothetical protein